MIKKTDPAPAQAFMTTTGRPSPPVLTSTIPAKTFTTLQQLMSQIGLHVQPQSSKPQAMYASRGRGRGSNRGRGDRHQSRPFNNNGGSRVVYVLVAAPKLYAQIGYLWVACKSKLDTSLICGMTRLSSFAPSKIKLDALGSFFYWAL
ncbi:hypothetical protein R6Q57_002948 [Mikania cordata]